MNKELFVEKLIRENFPDTKNFPPSFWKDIIDYILKQIDSRYALSSDIPTKNSQLENDSLFIVNNDLNPYITESELRLILKTVFDNLVQYIDEHGSKSGLGDYITPEQYGAKGDGVTDCTEALQKAILTAYNEKKKIHIPAGTYIVTDSIYIFDGIEIEGEGIYNTILKTPFNTDKNNSPEVELSKGSFNTVTDGESVPGLDYRHGHNRFYLGDGRVGYYDGDRDTNEAHPLYYPDDGSEEWQKWNQERAVIETQGRYIGATGREGYGKGLIKSCLNPSAKHAVNKKHYGEYIHCGVRNIKISDLQINTNSSDRSKDTAINFKYDASSIPSEVREKYDSSVLNVYLENLYLFSVGGSGVTATRAVDWTIINCYIRQCAESGIYMDGVTSIFITGCYCNSCLENGYKFKGVNYSTLNSCAADSCACGYALLNCKGVTLNSCGAEATRFQLGGEDQETIYKGRAFQIKSCKGVSLNSCYAMTSHLKDPNQITAEQEQGIEEFDSDFLESRHVYVESSKDVSINDCYFKAFQRIRTAPYRNEQNEKCNYQGGPYDPTQSGSRYWQVQNYLVGAQFEIKGESSENKVAIVNSSTDRDMQKESEIRTANLDILCLDPTKIPASVQDRFIIPIGTVTGNDGNGGWYYINDNNDNVPITISNFEFIFPINGTAKYGSRDFWWEFRNSLVLVRRYDDADLIQRYQEQGILCGYGYEDNEDQPIDWSTLSTINKYVVDLIQAYEDYTLIDGDKDLFEYGTLFHEDLSDNVLKPMLQTTIPGHVRQGVVGNRTLLNTNDYLFNNKFLKSTIGIVGNTDRTITSKDQQLIDQGKYTASDFKSGEVLSLLSRNSTDRDNPRPLFSIYDPSGNALFSVTDNKSGFVTKGDHSYLSNNDADLTPIEKLEDTASLADTITKLNDIIDRITVHGLAKENENPFADVLFTFTGYNSEDTHVMCNVKITCDAQPSKIGAAYSSTNTLPVYSNNHVTDDSPIPVSGGWQAGILVPRTSSTQNRYIRFYIETDPVGGESNRIYDDKVWYWTGNTISQYV